MALSHATPASTAKLLSQLPAVFQGGNEEAFEDIWFGEKGLHSTIDSLAEVLDACKAPREFLSWLSSWMGTALYWRLPEDKQRAFIANVSDYYKRRGTYVEGGPPFLFDVDLVLAPQDSDDPSLRASYVQRQEEIARAVIDTEKPAYAEYRLRIGIAHEPTSLSDDNPED
jgi:hypothetical protein